MPVASLDRLTLKVERMIDAEVLGEEDGAALQVEARQAREHLEKADCISARRHVESIVRMAEALVQSEALGMADGRAVIQIAREILALGSF